MSDKLSYTGHPQPLNCQIPLDVIGILQNLEGIELIDCLTHQPDIVPEININRSPDDLLDLSTTYLGTDPVQRTDVFNAQPSFPIILVTLMVNFQEVEKLGILLDTGISKSSVSKVLSEAYYM